MGIEGGVCGGWGCCGVWSDCVWWWGRVSGCVCRHDSCVVVVDCVWGLLGESCDGWYGAVLVKCGMIVGIVVRSWLGCVEVEGGACFW